MNKLIQIIHDLTASQMDRLMDIMDKNDWNVTTALTNRLSDIMSA